MRVLRITVFMHLLMPPVTTIMRDSDMQDTLESVAVQAVEEGAGALVLTDIFDMPDEEDIVVAGAAAMERIDVDQERMMSLLYGYAAMGLKRTEETGLLVHPAPAPLSVEDVEIVLTQLVNHPDYAHQTVAAASEPDGIGVVIRDGTVSREEDDDQPTAGP